MFRKARDWIKKESRRVAAGFLIAICLLLSMCAVVQENPQVLDFFGFGTGSGPVVEYYVDFCGTTGGFTGGQNISCRYNATGQYAQFFSPHQNTCTECNLSFMVKVGNYSSGNGKFYYATTNGTLANERYYIESTNATHCKISPEPGYDFSIGPFLCDDWTNVVIFTNYTSGNSTLYVYTSSGAAVGVLSGPKVNKSFTVTGLFFAVDTGGWNGKFEFTNYTVIDTLGTGSAGSGSGRVDIAGAINFSLNTPLNGSTTNASSVNVSFYVWNLNSTGGPGGNVWNLTDYDTFDSSDENWTGGARDTTLKTYNSTGTFGTARKNFNLSAVACPLNVSNITIDGFTYTDAANDPKIFVPGDTSSDNDYLLFDGTKPSINWKHVDDGGSFGECNIDFSGAVPWTDGDKVTIVTNRTSGEWCTYHTNTSGTRKCRCETSTLVNGNNFEISSEGAHPISLQNVSYSCLVTQSAADTTLNVSVYAANGTLLYNVTGVTNGSLVSFNWSTVVTGSYGWYVTVRNAAGNVLNVTGLNFTKTAATPAGNLSVVLVSPSANANVIKNEFFDFTVNVTCSGESCGNVNVYLDPVNIANNSFPVSPSAVFNGKTVLQWIQLKADALWNDTVVCGFNTGTPMCAVAWYGNSLSNADSNLHGCQGTLPGGATCLKDRANKRFPFVSDEGGNVLLIHAIATNQTRFELLLNFTNITVLSAANNLQCWAGYINGTQLYTNSSGVCSTSDSASDASLRILWALDIACAKQRAGVWLNQSGGFNIDYCAMFVQQGKNIWGNGYTVGHGEIKKLSSGRYYLANGYNNQVSAPTNSQSFRPDYFELTGLMDWAEFMGNATLTDGVIDILETYNASLYGGTGVATNTTGVHWFKTAHFASDGLSNMVCDDVGLPPNSTYNCATFNSEPQGTNRRNGSGVDAIDTWRAIAAVWTLYANHPEDIYSGLNDTLFMPMYVRYGPGNGTYGPTAAKPYEIRSDPTTTVARVKATANSERGTGMWGPSSVRLNGTFANDSVNYLTGGSAWDASNNQYYGEGYMDAYFSTFGIRFLAVATGLTAHNTYALIGEEPSIGAPHGTKNEGELVSTVLGDTPFYTINSNPQQGIGVGCLVNMSAGSSCLITFSVNATGGTDTTYVFWAYANSDISTTSNSSRINLTIVEIDTTAPVMFTPTVSVGSTTANISFVTNENSNDSLSCGLNTTLSICSQNSTMRTTHTIFLTGLLDGRTYYYNRTVWDFSGNKRSDTTLLNFTTNDVSAPSVVLYSPGNASTQPLSTLSFWWNATDQKDTTFNCSIYLNLTGSMVLNKTVSVTSGQNSTTEIQNIANGTYKWNVFCADLTGNGAWAAANFTFRENTTINIPTPTACSAQYAFSFEPSAAYLNLSTGKLTQYGIRPRNMTGCACGYTVNNTAGVNVTVHMVWNNTNTSYALRAANLTIPRNFTITNGTVACYNFTMDYINATRKLGNFTLNVTAGLT